MRCLSKPNKTKWKQKLRNPKILKRREYLVVTNTTRVSYKSPVSYHRQALTWRHYTKLFLIEATVDEDICCWVIKRSITVTITKLDMEILLRDNLQIFFFKLWNNSYAEGVYLSEWKFLSEFTKICENLCHKDSSHRSQFLKRRENISKCHRTSEHYLLNAILKFAFGRWQSVLRVRY